jgi:hypothetical protein
VSFNLPESAVEFLRAGKQLDYDYSKCEAGRVGLKRLDQLCLSEVRVFTHDTEGLEADPHASEFGYYTVPAISLSGECASYNPEFILLWLPEERIVGSWDCDHSVLIVFPNATWEEILTDPLPYLNAQWHPGTAGDAPFQPWPKYAFILC